MSVKGYFQILYSCIEKLLAFLNIKSFVLPATDEARSIWTEKFGFNKIPEEQVLKPPTSPYPYSKPIRIVTTSFNILSLFDPLYVAACELQKNLLANDNFQRDVHVKKASS